MLAELLTDELVNLDTYLLTHRLLSHQTSEEWVDEKKVLTMGREKAVEMA
jgi:hypothetical protein